MMEYAKAFMLYASDHGHFPKRGTPGADTNSALCLGFYPSNFCGLGSNPVSHGLAEDLKPYTSFPSVGPSIKFTTNETWTGALYNCHDSLTACKKARLIWLLEGENQTCARPANFNSSLQPSLYYGHTECRLEISVH